MGKKLKVVLLNGSPRRKGNTATALGWVEQALEEQGAKLRRHELHWLAFRGCLHCDSCKRRDEAPACKLRDDLREVLDDVVWADALVVASPVYCWKVSGPTAAALDRFYCFFKESGRSLIEGKQVAGVFTAGGDKRDGLDLCVEMLKRLSAYGRAAYRGSLAGVRCDEPAQTRERKDLQRQARALAARLKR
ncbi:MAG TPA: flavodoxin family protein [Myxococcota bacterium]|nr:flavodoxin family protein [Myxococcota bacterium]HRY93291.1 flavodoxin family protein [Myxococcota bacterium]HSA20399.1 flavodoxin family protein [Myxococcota bacterium]